MTRPLTVAAAQMGPVARTDTRGRPGFVEHGPRRLLLGCGFRRPFDTFTRVLT